MRQCTSDRPMLCRAIPSSGRRAPARWAAVFALCLGFVTTDAWLDSSTADARPRPAGRHKRRAFEANKVFGIGIMLGAPSGFSGKYYLSSKTALDFGVGTLYDYRDRRGLHLHIDHLWHPVSLVSADAFELPLYFGVGGRLFNGDRCYRYVRNVCDYTYRDYSALGVRVPFGIAFDFNDTPLDIFIEMAFVLDILIDRDDRYDDDAIYTDLNGAIGIRYYFK